MTVSAKAADWTEGHLEQAKQLMAEIYQSVAIIPSWRDTF